MKAKTLMRLILFAAILALLWAPSQGTRASEDKETGPFDDGMAVRERGRS